MDYNERLSSLFIEGFEDCLLSMKKKMEDAGTDAAFTHEPALITADFVSSTFAAHVHPLQHDVFDSPLIDACSTYLWHFKSRISQPFACFSFKLNFELIQPYQTIARVRILLLLKAPPVYSRDHHRPRTSTLWRCTKHPTMNCWHIPT